MTEEKATPPASRRSNPKLPEALQEAQILLAYVSQSAIAVSDEVVKTVISSGSLLANNVMTDEHEAAFWSALNTLAKAVAPVSIDSLRAIMDPNPKTILGFKMDDSSLARKAVRRYTGIAIFTLLFLLLFQVYWLFGTSITADIQKTDEKLSAAQTKLETTGKHDKPAPSTSKKSAAEPTTGASQQEFETAVLKAQAANLSLHSKSSYELLRLWSIPWQNLALANRIKDSDESTGDKTIERNTARFQTAEIILEVLQRYLLPLLYGLLGTCVFVLRTISLQITTRTYTEASNIGFRIRLYLGMLGGMVFAWFVTPESADGLFKSLSPFALAFLSGYSVELLFAAMDRFLIAFTSKTAT